MNKGQERRSSIRRPIHHDAILHLGELHHVPCVIADYCLDGMFLKFDRQYIDFLNSLRKEDLLDLSFLDSRGKEHHIAAHLAHKMTGAFGMRFTQRHSEAIRALVEMNKGRSAVPDEETKRIVEECIECIQNTTQPLMQDLWSVLVEEVRLSATEASSDQKGQELMALAEKIDNNQRELQSGFSLAIQDPLSAFSEHVDMSAKMSDSLSLVDKGDFEDWLTSRVLITKCETEYRSELLPLKVRLDAVGIGDKKHHQSAFGPALLVSAFHSAVVPLRLKGVIEKLVYKTFEKQVMMSLSGLYLGLNQILVDHNILPNLDLAKAIKSRSEPTKPNVPAPEREKKPEHDVSNENAVHETSGDSSLSSGRSSSSHQGNESLGAENIVLNASDNTASSRPRISSFIDSLGGGSGQADNHSAFVTAPPFQSNEGETRGALPTHEGSVGDDTFQKNQADVQSALNNVVGLMRSLRQKTAEQNQNSISTSTVPGIEAGEAGTQSYSEGELVEGLSELQGASESGKLDERPSLMSRVQENLKQQGEEKQFNEQQQVAIDVVDRFFYSMRNNPRISSEAKQHLLKLEVPVLKVLLKDERFFEDHNSSVRAVMNRIAQLGAKGATLNPVSRRRVSELVEQIVQEFEQDTAVFDVVLAELDRLIEKQNKLYIKNVERVAAAADGVHKVDEAKIAVAKALNDRFEGKQVPSAVSVLVENGWKDLLNLTHIKHGEESEQWQTYLSVLDRLIAFGNNPDVPVDAKKILPIIQEGLKLVSGTNEASGEVRESLKQLIQNAPRGSHAMVQPKLQEVPETEDELVKRNLSKSQELKPWIVKAKSIEAGTWLQLEREEGEAQYMRLVWIAKGYSKFVCVNHQGMKVVELGLLKFARYLRDQKITLDIDYELPMVNQSLDNMVAEVYDKIAYESNYDEGSGLIRKSEFCRQVRSLMKTGKRTAECYLIYARFYDTQTDETATLKPEFAKKVASQLNGINGEGILGRIDGSDFVLFGIGGNDEFLGLRCQDILETLCEAEENELSVLIGESKAHMGFFNPESMIRHSLSLIEESFEKVRESGEATKAENDNVHESDNDELSEDKVPTLYLDESENILPESTEFSDLNLALKIQPVDCLNAEASGPQGTKDFKESLLKNHVNLLCFVEGDHQPFEVSGAEDAKELDEWWIDKLISLQAESHPIFEDENFIRVQISAHSLGDIGFVEQILNLQKEKKISCDKICFDIYDCSVLEDIHATMGYMKQLKTVGIKFCLDHFGSERSPFAFLKALPFDMIKIDESFMYELNRDEGDEIAADSIIEIAHYLGKKVLVNRVDTAICLQKMKHLNVDFVQGSTISPYIDM